MDRRIHCGLKHLRIGVLTLASLILKLLAQAVGQQVKERWIILPDANEIGLVFGPFAQTLRTYFLPFDSHGEHSVHGGFFLQCRTS
jgi:hypothetical protein